MRMGTGHGVSEEGRVWKNTRRNMTRLGTRAAFFSFFLPFLSSYA
jgi:hypothetical protein